MQKMQHIAKKNQPAVSFFSPLYFAASNAIGMLCSTVKQQLTAKTRYCTCVNAETDRKFIIFRITREYEREK
jgi:hypothetical protein